MAALLVVGLAVPEAFGESALIFACAYAFVRVMHIALFTLASREDPNLRTSVIGLMLVTPACMTSATVSPSASSVLMFTRAAMLSPQTRTQRPCSLTVSRSSRTASSG